MVNNVFKDSVQYFVPAFWILACGIGAEIWGIVRAYRKIIEQRAREMKQRIDAMEPPTEYRGMPQKKRPEEARQ